MDANILIRDFWLEGTHWSYLKKRHFLGHTLVVPDVALQEATSHIERRARDLLLRIEAAGMTPKLADQYQRLFRRASSTAETPEQLGQRYRRFITRTLKQHNGFVDVPPDVKVSQLLKRSIDRTKPFSKGDKGFRDTLIWLGVVELVRKFHRVSLISANTSDYAEGDSLHSDLEADLQPVLPESYHFRYFAGIPEFIAFMNRDGSAGAAALKAALMSTGYRTFRLDRWLTEHIAEIAADYEYDGVPWTALPYWAENPRLTEVIDLVGIELHGEQALEGDRIELFCDVALVGVFQCSILSSTWEGMIHPIQLEWVDEESSDAWTEVGVRSIGTFLLRIVFDLNKAKIVQRDIATIHHDIQAAKDALIDVQQALPELVS